MTGYLWTFLSGFMNLGDAKTRSLLQAGSAYVANNWMHTPWLTTLVAREMLSNLSSSLLGENTWRWWPYPVACLWAGLIPGLYFPNTRTLGVLLSIVGVGALVAGFRIVSIQEKLGRIINEVQSGFYSGRVLAERLEQLNHSRFEFPSILVVPSILVEVLRVHDNLKNRPIRQTLF